MKPNAEIILEKLENATTELREVKKLCDGNETGDNDTWHLANYVIKLLVSDIEKRMAPTKEEDENGYSIDMSFTKKSL